MQVLKMEEYLGLRNNGDNWTELITDFTTNIISSLAINGEYIFAGTPDGLFRAKLNDITDVKDKNQNSENIIYPNPSIDNLNIVFNNNKPENKIEIINLLGTKVMEYYSQEQRATINIESLARGVYFLRIGNQTKMFVKE